MKLGTNIKYKELRKPRKPKEPKDLCRKSSQSCRGSSSIRISVRITPNTVSSISLKKNIISLWLLGTENEKSEKNKNKNFVRNVRNVRDFMYQCLDKWKYNTAKGFSDFVTEKMIQDILEELDFIEYKKILKRLEKI